MVVFNSLLPDMTHWVRVKGKNEELVVYRKDTNDQKGFLQVIMTEFRTYKEYK